VIRREHLTLRHRDNVADNGAKLRERLQVRFAFFPRAKIGGVDHKDRLRIVSNIELHKGRLKPRTISCSRSYRANAVKPNLVDGIPWS
jgi:hypothetical protein